MSIVCPQLVPRVWWHAHTLLTQLCPFLLRLTAPCRCRQIDLSDDYLLLTLFADGQWENDAQVIQISDGSKQTPLQMDEQQFKDLVGVIRTLQVGEPRRALVGTATVGECSSSAKLVRSAV